MADDENTQEQPVNCWQYSRDVYLIGRSLKFRPFTEYERTAVIEFITAMAGTRPAYVPYINIKAENPPANEFTGEGDERTLAWTCLEKQGDNSLAKMVQKIGRSLKIQFCTAEEKELCDALFEATDARRHQTLNDYEDTRVSSSDSSAESGESSSAAPSSSSAPVIPSSSSSEEESSGTGL